MPALNELRLDVAWPLPFVVLPNGDGAGPLLLNEMNRPPIGLLNWSTSVAVSADVLPTGKTLGKAISVIETGTFAVNVTGIEAKSAPFVAVIVFTPTKVELMDVSALPKLSVAVGLDSDPAPNGSIVVKVMIDPTIGLA